MMYMQSSHAPSLTPSNQPNDQRVEEDSSYIFILIVLTGLTTAAAIPLWLQHTTCCRKDEWDPVTKKRNNAQSILHNKLIWIYLPAFLLAVCADWLQGPYKYALFSSYGYSQQHIAYLYIAGCMTGITLGSYIVGLADLHGRKKLCLGYCLASMISILLYHCKYFYALMLGRACGGIATSLLYCCFESWLICAHGKSGLSHKNGLQKDEEEKWVAKSLSLSMYGSSLVAIGSGIFANFVVERTGKMRPLSSHAEDDEASALYIGGYISAFDLCLLPLVLCATVISCFWEENYGQQVDPKEEEGYTPWQRHGQQSSWFCSLFSKKSDSTSLNDSMIFDDRIVSRREVESEETIEKLMDGDKCCPLEKIIVAEPNIHDDEDLESPLLIVEPKRKERRLSNFLNGINTVWLSPNILNCCIVEGVFEGALLVFLFLWTPTLNSLRVQVDGSENEVPLGTIYSSFMVCCMLGSIVFSHLSGAGVSAVNCLVVVLALAAISCLVMACPLSTFGSGASSVATTPQYFGMLVYEVSVGFYYPAMGTVKAAVVPEEQRAAVYSVFRLPLNLFMLVNLLCDQSYENSFIVNAIFLMVVCILQILHVWRNRYIGDSQGRFQCESVESSTETMLD